MKAFFVAVILPGTQSGCSNKWFYGNGKGFTSIPMNTPSNAECLNLSTNKIEHISKMNFEKFHILFEIDLVENKISELTINSFGNLSELTKLFLSKNRIFRIENNSFMLLHQLKFLDLSGNRLSYLKQGMFYGLNKVLRYLDVSFNKIEQIEHCTFERLTLLKVINLSANEMVSLFEQWFQNLSRPMSIILNDPTVQKKETYYDCKSLCWLKEEEKLGLINTSLPQRSERNKPLCRKGIKWDTLNCSIQGKESATILWGFITE